MASCWSASALPGLPERPESDFRKVVVTTSSPLRGYSQTPSRLRRTPPWQGERLYVLRLIPQNNLSPLLSKEGWRSQRERRGGWARWLSQRERQGGYSPLFDLQCRRMKYASLCQPASHARSPRCSTPSERWNCSGMSLPMAINNFPVRPGIRKNWRAQKKTCAPGKSNSFPGAKLKTISASVSSDD